MNKCPSKEEQITNSISRGRKRQGEFYSPIRGGEGYSPIRGGEFYSPLRGGITPFGRDPSSGELLIK
jgi:hypothetical protein